MAQPFPSNNSMPWAPEVQARANVRVPSGGGAAAISGLPWVQRPKPLSLEQALEGPDADYWHDFMDAKSETNNFFAYYRAGRSSERGEPWKLSNAVRNPASILYRTMAEKFGRIAGPWENIYRPDGPLGVPRRATQSRYPPRLPSNDPRVRARLDSKGRASSRRIQDLMNERGINIQIKKILGAGGNGVALLCDGPSETPGQRGGNCVLKAHIRGGSMRSEKELMMVCQDAPSSNEMSLSADLLVYLLCAVDTEASYASRTNAHTQRGDSHRSY